MKYKNILIIGLGLMGGSMGLALLKLREETKSNFVITGLVRSRESKTVAKKKRLADNYFTLDEFECEKKYKDYDLIVLAIPVAASIEFLNKFSDIDTGTVVIDAGSTKKDLVNKYLNQEFYNNFIFIPSHPMAGTEFAGPQAAIYDLYQDKLCFLIPPNSEQILKTLNIRLSPAVHLQIENAKADVVEFWEALGSICFDLQTEEHDEALAYLSHTPHLLSALLTIWAMENSVVHKLTEKSPIPITGGGFKGLIRIAGSNPEMWREIILTNKKNIIDSLESFNKGLNFLIDIIKKKGIKEWNSYFERALEAKLFLSKEK
jgi:prephenate dehydrogenase